MEVNAVCNAAMILVLAGAACYASLWRYMD